VASLVAALAVLGQLVGKVGSGSVFTSSMKRQNMEPNPPNGPIAIGIELDWSYGPIAIGIKT
jgi:hypothetical protein